MLQVHISIVNSLAPGKFEWNFEYRYIIFKQILVIDGWGISCECALIWMSLDFTDDQSTLIQVMAWCRQATSHCLSQCWPRSLLPYGVTRPQWFNSWHHTQCHEQTWLKLHHCISILYHLMPYTVVKTWYCLQLSNDNNRTHLSTDRWTQWRHNLILASRASYGRVSSSLMNWRSCAF